MHRSKVIYVLAYPRFSPATTKKIAMFRAAHEPDRARLVRPHITLVFGLADLHKPELLERCKDLASNTSGFAVSFGSIEGVYDPFEEAHKLFLICDAGAGSLTGMHKQIHAGPLQCNLDPDHPFRPHMTVATQPNRAAIDRLDPRALGVLPINGRIDALDIVDVADGRLRAIATFPLLP